MEMLLSPGKMSEIRAECKSDSCTMKLMQSTENNFPLTKGIKWSSGQYKFAYKTKRSTLDAI